MIFNFKNNEFPDTKFETLLWRIITEGSPFKVICPHTLEKRPFILNENTDWTKERKECHSIYMQFCHFIENNISQEELDMINTFREYTSVAQFPYVFDLSKSSTLNAVLKNNSFILNTVKGPLKFQFSTYEDENIQKDSAIFAYDDKDQRIIFFVDDPNNVTKEEVINILRNKRRLNHEFVHFIDDMNDELKKYNDIESEVDYINKNTEVKAIIQDLVMEFGRYIFKYHKDIKPEELKDTNTIEKYLNEFLSTNNRDYKNKYYTIQLFSTYLHNFSDDNLKLLSDTLEDYFKYVFNTEDDINLSESNNWKYKQLLRLWRGNEYFKVLNNKNL